MILKAEDGWDYLGDGVYFNDRGYELELVTYNGIEVRDRIVLESRMVKTLFERWKGFAGR
jgi:hypothetical protein